MEKILKEILQDYIKKERIRNGLTQEQMAEALCMDPRSYSYIEHGEHSCGTLTAVLLLIKTPYRDQMMLEMEQQLTACMDKYFDQSFPELPTLLP